MEGSHRALIPREETTLALPAFPTRTAMAGLLQERGYRRT